MIDDMSDGDVNEIVTQTIRFADTNGDERLNFEEFKVFYHKIFQITI